MDHPPAPRLCCPIGCEYLGVTAKHSPELEKKIEGKVMRD